MLSKYKFLRERQKLSLKNSQGHFTKKGKRGDKAKKWENISSTSSSAQNQSKMHLMQVDKAAHELELFKTDISDYSLSKSTCYFCWKIFK